MVELMGAKDVEVKCVGLHPAERLHEMLLGLQGHPELRPELPGRRERRRAQGALILGGGAKTGVEEGLP